jgi:type IV pilus assembly protein PilY1
VIVSSTSGVDRDGNGTISASEADERQNFANWYSFYRTRNLMTISAASIAMFTLPTTIRVAWQGLKTCRGSTSSLVTADCEGWQTTATNFSNAIKPFTSTQKTNFYSWLMRLPTTASTPLREAMSRVGEYYKISGAGSPYDDDLSGSINTEAICRKNFHLLMTDGIWNDSVTGYGNYDSTSHTLPDAKTYSSSRPYLDTNSNSLADVAFSYWATDLRSALGNGVAPSLIDLSGNTTYQYFNAKNDPATWQHMVNYTVGLGLTPFLNSTAGGNLTWGTNSYDGSYLTILAGTQNWPTTSNSGVDGNAGDLWHAAINSRGKFYNVDSPSDLNNAFQDIVDTVSSAAAAGGGSGVSSNVSRTTDAGATAFVARFNADWSGALQAFALSLDGTLGITAYWEAGSLIPPGNLPSSAPPFQRKIFTRNGGSAQEFASCTSTLATALNMNASGTVDGLCSQRLAWLRGYTAITGASWSSATNRVTFTAPNHGLNAGNVVVVTGVTPTAYNGTYPVASVGTDTFIVNLSSNPGTYVTDETDNTLAQTGDYALINRSNDDRVRYSPFRDRSSVLGDITMSNTVYAYKDAYAYNDNQGYGGATIAVSGGGDPYKTYVAGKASLTPTVYAGANDGMLHAFNAAISGTDMGKEIFAYVPAGVYANLSALTNPGYVASHKFFVDGTPTVGDAYIGGWKTYLVGGLRAGGKSIYALDVSNSSSFAAENVKWEFTETDLGLTFGQPQIGPVSATQWAAIFGNGYNGTADKAYLYIVDLSNGTQIAKIATSSDTSNGLSTPYLFDSTGDGIVDVIYAGDLQGKLWKFQNSSGTWSLGNGGVPLFNARLSDTSTTMQAITSQPKVKQLTDGKVMVYFGTGRYLEAGDLTNDAQQTFYAIWDDPLNSGHTVSHSELLAQTIISSTVSTPLFTTARTVSQNVMGATNRGCYLNLPATTGQPSERITSSPVIKSFTTAELKTRVIFVTSTPASDPCEKGGSSWLMELSASCGRLEGTSPFDTNNDTNFDSSDLVTISPGVTGSVSGGKLNTTTGIVNEFTWIEGEGTKGIAYKILPGSSGQVESIANSSDIVNPGGAPKRISWEQIQ